MPWIFVVVAVASEISGTLGLRAVAKHPQPLGVALVALAYIVSFAALGVALRALNVGVVYAIWSAVGTATVASLGAVIFRDRLNAVAIFGLVLIVGGVVALVCSGSAQNG